MQKKARKAEFTAKTRRIIENRDEGCIFCKMGYHMEKATWMDTNVLSIMQVSGTDQSIFTREDLVTIQRCLSIFEIAINNQPTAYDVEKVVEAEEKFLVNYGVPKNTPVHRKIIDIVRNGWKE